MKVFAVLRESVKVYVKNFADLMGAYLVEAALRAMCFVPLMFLSHPDTAFLAWLCVPLYLLIALPARQNYAIALQDMLYGGRVLSPRLISFEGYGRKLLRGLGGALKMLCWLALPIAGVVLMLEVYYGKGSFSGFVMGFWGVTGRDGLSAMRWFQMLGKDTVGGLINLMLVVISTFLLPVIGCAVHCGGRHAAALEEKKLLRGKRLKMMLLWALGFVVFLPFVAVVLTVMMSDLKAFVLGFAQMFLTQSIAGPELGERLYIIMAAFALLFVTMVPLKQLIPAVAAHQQMKAAYPALEKAEAEDNAQA